ncbi:MAG: hypothetical protein JXX29_08750 [Deltaproteobacteria bacterium]|nr:hypothetical protein [Deltaproteobacteria bacterium]
MLIGVKYADMNGDGHKHAEDVGMAWLAGASIGWKLKQSEKWRILPEMAAMYDFENKAVHFAILIGWARVFH